MIRQKRRVLALGVSVGVVLVALGWPAIRPVLFAESRPHTRASIGEEQRLQEMALRDLRETQDEVARMKAHGIGMHPHPDGEAGN
jgi:hypothetical protein